MATYFLDTSALVKRYVAEPGHQWLRALFAASLKNDFYISQIAFVELVATLCRKEREQVLSASERDALVQGFYRHRSQAFNTILLTNEVCIQAGVLCQTYRLRAYDAVQLASVLALRQRLLAFSSGAPIFVCADSRLLAIAGAEQLRTANPLDYP